MGVESSLRAVNTLTVKFLKGAKRRTPPRRRPNTIASPFSITCLPFLSNTPLRRGERLLSTGVGSVDAQVSEIQRFVTERLADLRNLLYGNVELARAELRKRVTEIRMIPHQTEQKGFYVAEGEWNLLGGYHKTGRARHLSGVRARLVAGVGFEPTTFGL